jgi:hypothetical protein
MSFCDKTLILIEELKKKEAEHDLLYLENEIQIKSKIIKTFGELKKNIKSFNQIYNLKLFLSENDYFYIHNWYSTKEKEKNKNNI